VTADPDEPDGAADGALGGRLLVWYGSARGIAWKAEPVRLTQNTPGVPGASEKGDGFGGFLAVADLNRDGAADLVAGSPGDDTGATNAGQTPGRRRPSPGRRAGALGGGAYAFTQDTADIPGAGETEDEFGTTVAAADIDKDGRPELFMSAALENSSTGAVWVLPGGADGPTAKGSRMITCLVRRPPTAGEHPVRRQRTPRTIWPGRPPSAVESAGGEHALAQPGQAAREQAGDVHL
jgi:hypothetical protein